MATLRAPWERRAAALAEMSALLGSSLDYERALPHFVRLAVPVLGDLCAIHLLDHGALRRVACAHVDPAREALVSEIGAWHTADPAAARGVAAVMRTRQPVLVVRATEAALREAAQDVEQLVPLRQLAPRSWIVVPLVAHARVLGALTLAVTESARPSGQVGPAV